MKYGFSYNYLYQATQPSTGQIFSMFLPRMDGECFQIFIEAFTQRYPGQCLIMDNAGSHKTTLETRLNQQINIEFLSAYSPDFNPQERMFQEIKKVIKGKFFQTIEPIELLIENEVKAWEARPDKVKKVTAWHWII